MSTDLIKVRAKPEEIEKIENVANECQIQLRNTGTPFAASFALAAGVKMMEELITAEMMQDVMALQGKPLGFKTDKDRDKHGNPGPGYPVEIVRPAFIEATVRGFRPINNEFNIIAGRFYGCKTGFERMVKTFPGLTDFQESFAVPERAGGKSLVGYVASWRLNGLPGGLERKPKQLHDGSAFDDRFVVRVNEGMGDDAILGKAKRKAYAAIYDVLTGSVLSTPEGDAGDVIDAESTSVGGPKVQRSSLFMPGPPSDKPSQHDQAELVDEYQRELDSCTKKAQVGPIAKKAGGDSKLTDASRADVMARCAKRRNIKADTQVQAEVDATTAEEAADQAQIRDDYLQLVADATGKAALVSLQNTVAADKNLRRSNARSHVMLAIDDRLAAMKPKK